MGQSFASPVKLELSVVRDNLHRLPRAHTEMRQLAWWRARKICVFPRNDYEPACFCTRKAAQSHPINQIISDFIAEILSESTERLDRGPSSKTTKLTES
jgi:hypothetical protein